jgi:hypothetical protein
LLPGATLAVEVDWFGSLQVPTCWRVEPDSLRFVNRLAQSWVQLWGNVRQGFVRHCGKRVLMDCADQIERFANAVPKTLAGAYELVIHLAGSHFAPVEPTRPFGALGFGRIAVGTGFPP